MDFERVEKPSKIVGGEILIKVDDDGADTKIIYCDYMVFDGEDGGVDNIVGTQREG